MEQEGSSQFLSLIQPSALASKILILFIFFQAPTHQNWKFSLDFNPFLVFFFWAVWLCWRRSEQSLHRFPFHWNSSRQQSRKKTLGRLFLGWNCAISDLTLRGVPGNVKKNPNSLFPERKFILGLLPLTCLTCRAAGAEFWGKILKNLIYSLPSPTEIFQDFSHQRNIPKPKQPNLQGGFIFIVFFNEWSFKTNQMWVESTSLS